LKTRGISLLRIAITRAVSPAIERCELTHLEREPIDLRRAEEQHREYSACLVRAGCEVLALPAEPALPDSVFVEDCAVVLEEVAVVTRPGATSRRPETNGIADALQAYRPLLRISEPGTLDGGDVLLLGRTLYVGRSTRSNSAGIEQLGRLLVPFGYEVRELPIDGCLHLKSAVTRVAGNLLLFNPDRVDGSAFTATERIEVDPREPEGANALLVGETVIYPAAFPRTRRRMEARGIEVEVVEISELAKAEGGVTCCSLVFEAHSAENASPGSP
jgi:dimethylargininase